LPHRDHLDAVPASRPINPKILRWRATLNAGVPPRSAGRKGIFRVIPIAVTTWPDEATRTSNSACVWIAEATIEGRIYTARSRHGPANELARALVAAALLDRQMVIHCLGLAGTMTYRSFRAAATWTFSEGERALRRVRGQANFPEYHYVYIEPGSYEIYRKTGIFPEGTILFKELQLTLGPPKTRMAH
jgi:hypothetical protein